ncbi:recombinase family protein [Clostridium sp. BL-8]|uniref:recombinase family protein n=1 Tax=Clostridium sp. BL-8 TaxID=349938 RepID=UPI00325B9C70
MIYCESISRLGRNVDDLRATCDYFKNKGVTVYFVKEGINADGDGYKFILTILGAVAEMERENTVERV